MNDVAERLSSWPLYLLGGFIAAAGLFLAAGGLYLIALGGSLYFALLGCALVVSAVLIVRGKPHGAWSFGAAFVVSIFWAVWDAGVEFWPLVSRLFALGVLAFLVALAYPLLASSDGRAPRRGLAYGIAALIGLGLILTVLSAFSPKSVVVATEKSTARATSSGSAAQINWAHWGNTTAGARFAALDQINKQNISRLEVAWTAHTGDVARSNGLGAEDQNTPLQIGDSLFVCTPYGKVLSLDVDTGAQRWKFDPGGAGPNWQRCRGLGFYEVTAPASADTVPACARRIFLPTNDARLIALDADRGTPCQEFGEHGTVDLKMGMGEVEPGFYQQTSTPLIASDLVIVGGRVADNFSTDEPPGVVRAYDARSGRLVWAWDPGMPEITGLPPEGKTYTRGTPNVWSAMSYDAALDLIYLPTGNATPDFWAGRRTAFDDRYSSSIVALEAHSGRVRWVFQLTHHDIWDFDVPAQPLLYDLPGEGGGQSIPALVQVTKQGEIFLLNRATGEPIAEVEERPVPAGNTPGERYSPTQPFSVGMPSIGNQTLRESDMWGATLFDQMGCRISFRKMRHAGPYTPPGLDPALQFPGSLGGMNWGGASVDPNTSYLFVNDMRVGLANYLIPRDRIAVAGSGIGMGVVPQEGTPFGAMRQRFLSPLGVPCQKPPFGTISAIDLETRKLVWQVPVGTVEDTGPLGVPMHLHIPIGMPTLGGSLATQSGLLFFAGTQDNYLRAFDSATGREIWKARLPVGSQSGPMTYRSPKSKKQYIVVTAGGARFSPRRGDYVIAYTLRQ